MSPTSSQWATLLPLVEKVSGKELLLAAAPVLLAIPGILDEAIAVVVGLILVGGIFLVRKHINNNAESIAKKISLACKNGEVSQEEANTALSSLKRLTASADA